MINKVVDYRNKRRQLQKWIIEKDCIHDLQTIIYEESYFFFSVAIVDTTATYSNFTMFDSCFSLGFTCLILTL